VAHTWRGCGSADVVAGARARSGAPVFLDAGAFPVVRAAVDQLAGVVEPGPCSSPGRRPGDFRVDAIVDRVTLPLTDTGRTRPTPSGHRCGLGETGAVVALSDMVARLTDAATQLVAAVTRFVAQMTTWPGRWVHDPSRRMVDRS